MKSLGDYIGLYELSRITDTRLEKVNLKKKIQLYVRAYLIM